MHLPHPTHEQLADRLGDWKQLVRPYQNPSSRKAAWQLINTLVPLAAAWIATYLSLELSIWLAAVMAMPTALLVSRLFIVQHDCGHQSFVRGRLANAVIGLGCSLITSVPFHYWAKTHRHHHKHNGSTQGRGIGDVPFLRVSEYQRLPRTTRALYRFYRHPLVLFGLAPVIYLFVSQRVPFTPLRNPWQTIRRQLANNLALAGLYAALGSVLGWYEFFVVQGFVLVYFAIIAFWIFHVQHLHEHTLKQDPHEWNYLASAMRGSSHYDLPAVLHWFTGNIGIHHIHHLSPSIPNYELQRCLREQPILTAHASSVSFGESLSQIHSDLWDDEHQKMISFAELSAREPVVRDSYLDLLEAQTLS